MIEMLNKIMDILDGSHAILPGFSKPKAPAALPPPPTREDPSIAAAREKLRLSAKRRKGRRASVLTSNQGVDGKPAIIKTASLGGQDNKLSI